METPWMQQRCVTKTRLPFSAWRSGDYLHVGQGNGARAACHLISKTLLLWPTLDSLAPELMELYDFNFAQYQGCAGLRIGMHPFAVLHLLVAEAIQPRFLIETLSEVWGAPANSHEHDIDTECIMLQQLGIKSVNLVFATNHNLTVYKGG